MRNNEIDNQPAGKRETAEEETVGEHRSKNPCFDEAVQRLRSMRGTIRGVSAAEIVADKHDGQEV